MHTMQTEIAGASSSEQVLGFLSTLFAMLALLLTATGLFGVLSYAVARRTREIGLRIAIGATSADIVVLFLRETIPMVLIGVTLGVPAALISVALLKSQLFGVTPHDPVALGLAGACILITACLASMLPIRNALSIAPQLALRID
jgi:ABC-type antimicrobial peptide transport system permease subunit